jgi:hypothetical protein
LIATPVLGILAICLATVKFGLMRRSSRNRQAYQMAKREGIEPHYPITLMYGHHCDSF